MERLVFFYAKIEAMKYKEIKLKNFRNYTSRTFSFHEKVNLFLGKNARGKTNLLESLYVTAYGKSFRTSKEKEMVQFGEEMGIITGTFQRELLGDEDNVIEIIIDKNGKRKGKINGIAFEKYSDIFDHVLAVVFSPEDLKIIKESPEKRRDFMNREMSSLSISAYRNLMMYNRALQQRNAYLKQEQRDKALLSVWDENLLLYGGGLILQRKKFIDKLNGICKSIHEELTGGNEKIDLRYESDIGTEILESWSSLQKEEILSVESEKEINKNSGIESKNVIDKNSSREETEDRKAEAKKEATKPIIRKQEEKQAIKRNQKEKEKEILEEIKEEFRSVFYDSIESDLRNRHTTRGPQKDDIEVLINGIPARNFGSQGQQRTAALSMKLAEIELIKEERGEYPILLLDDVLSELDISRQNYLIGSLKDVQMFITATELPEEVVEKLPDSQVIDI